MNAVTFFLDFIGALCSWLLGTPLLFVSFEVIYAYLVAYLLYWLVVCAVPGGAGGGR